MVYLDTSVAVALLTPEISSDAAINWLTQTNEPLIGCDWITTEFASALAIKHRNGQLSTKELKATQNEFDQFVRTGVRLAPVTREMFAQAAALAGDPANKLRAGDALHLAAALLLGAKAIATLDHSMARNAKKFGLNQPLQQNAGRSSA
jgi:uncharacterized protein